MRSVLLDTQVLLWFLLSDPKLPKIVLELIEQEDVRLLFHQVSLWEIQIKYELGKLRLPSPPWHFILPAALGSGLEKADLQDEAVFFLGKVPNIHRDPFDRLLISHLLVNGWEFATADSIMHKYPIRILKDL
ncbi:type II toxin-antitoxin system VapC family toxin [Leptospira langatensis]|uniref:Type II toxin-antitoxin system VapC family toxin n=1 Tax=Leptospira langatensis TaxID=2484983 RepID=A0A5F1ZUL4_9LEPT|nr:type II toxin-antitoxin system VapC family toxin [Leptospira langatensis]TGK00227.1 type II toxin-antitoxin system VapC family toxin [Leptospira langatensis]TGL41139.1 type II toxin-antitoxin system VapC family toxin [Leptospira langatensis]